MIELAASDVLLNSFPPVGCEAWRASVKTLEGSVSLKRT